MHPIYITMTEAFALNCISSPLARKLYGCLIDRTHTVSTKRLSTAQSTINSVPAPKIKENQSLSLILLENLPGALTLGWSSTRYLSSHHPIISSVQIISIIVGTIIASSTIRHYMASLKVHKLITNALHLCGYPLSKQKPPVFNPSKELIEKVAQEIREFKIGPVLNKDASSNQAADHLYTKLIKPQPCLIDPNEHPDRWRNSHIEGFNHEIIPRSIRSRIKLDFWSWEKPKENVVQLCSFCRQLIRFPVYAEVEEERIYFEQAVILACLEKTPGHKLTLRATTNLGYIREATIWRENLKFDHELHQFMEEKIQEYTPKGSSSLSPAFEQDGKRE